MKKFAIITLILLCVVSNIFALTNSSITYTLLSGEQLFTDANNCAATGPRANYLQIKITNNSGVAQNNLAVTLLSFSNPTHFSLAGGQAATQNIALLGTGESDTLYWFIRYPSCVSTQSSSITFITNDLDDNTTATSLVKNEDGSTSILSNGGLISANATGQSSPLIITRNDNVIGGIISFRARYDFNTISTGAGIWFQPVGNLSFNAAAYQLVGARICNYVHPAFVPCMLPQTTPLNYKCKLNYIATCSHNGNSNKYFFVEYDFRINLQAASYAAPYATGLSGNPYKYTYDSTFRVSLNTLTALPVEMASFDLKSADNGNVLQWATDNETNNQKFIIERSLDGNIFEAIGEVSALGNTTQKTSYQFLDEENPASACYRILNEDIDGKLFQHDTKCVELQNVALKVLSISPNPANKEVNIAFQTSSFSEETKISIFDAQGRMIYTQTQNSNIGVNEIRISLENYTAGLYFVKINDGIYSSKTYKFIKE